MPLIPFQSKETAPHQAKSILERYEQNLGMIPLLHTHYNEQQRNRTLKNEIYYRDTMRRCQGKSLVRSTA